MSHVFQYSFLPNATFSATENFRILGSGGGSSGNMPQLHIKCWNPAEGDRQGGFPKWFELALGLHPGFLSWNFWNMVIAKGY